MTDPRRATPPTDHAAHDLLLVAAAADRAGHLPAAQADCPDCRALHADLVALAAAVPHAALPARPRAYTLTPADAARLRPAGWRRWLAAIGTSRDAVTRPLALGLTTLGIAGLLVATVPGALPFAASSGAAPAPAVASPGTDTAAGAASTPAADPELGPAAAPAATRSLTTSDTSAMESPAPTDDGAVFSGTDGETAAASAAGGAPADTKTSNGERLADADGGPSLSPVSLVAAALLLVGLVLFALRWGARRSI